jgi:VanZ family protein
MLVLRHRVLWIAISVVMVLLVVWGSLEPASKYAPPDGFDKVEHFGSYMLLAVWFTGMVRRARYWTVVTALILLGIAMEAGQYLMHMGRTADPYDVAANAAGVALGTALALAVCGGWLVKVDAWLSRS